MHQLTTASAFALGLVHVIRERGGEVAHSLPIPFPTPPGPPAQRLSRQHKEAPTSPLRIFFCLPSLAIPKKLFLLCCPFLFFFCAIFSHNSIYPLKKKSPSKELCFFSCFYYYYYYYHHFITSLLLLLTLPNQLLFYFFLKIIIIDLFWSWSRWFDFCCTGSLRRRIVFVCVFCCTVKTWLFGKKCAGSCTDFGKRSKHLSIYTQKRTRRPIQ